MIDPEAAFVQRILICVIKILTSGGQRNISDEVLFVRRVDHHESTPGLLTQLTCVCVVGQSCLGFVTYGKRGIVQVSVDCAFRRCKIYNKRLAVNLFTRFKSQHNLYIFLDYPISRWEYNTLRENHICFQIPIYLKRKPLFF